MAHKEILLRSRVVEQKRPKPLGNESWEVALWPGTNFETRSRILFCGVPRFRALGVDSGPRGGPFEGVLDPRKNKKWLLWVYFTPIVLFLGWATSCPWPGLFNGRLCGRVNGGSFGHGLPGRIRLESGLRGGWLDAVPPDGLAEVELLLCSSSSLMCRAPKLSIPLLGN